MSAVLHRRSLMRELLRILHGGADRESCWCRDEVIDALSWDPRAPAGQPCLEVAVREGWPLCTVPRRLYTRWGSVPLLAVRHAPARLQRLNVPRCSNESTAGHSQGTVACLTQDRFDARRVYALTCGHVLGESVRAGFNDRVSLSCDAASVQIQAGRLVEWTTPFANGGSAFELDAALAELSLADRQRVFAQCTDLPAAAIRRDLAAVSTLQVRVEAGAVPGRLFGETFAQLVLLDVLLDDLSMEQRSVRLDRLVRARLDGATHPGDSGAAVWDDNQALLGLHCAFSTDSDSSDWNALFTPIGPVMDRMNVDPITHASMAAPLPAAPTQPALAANAAAEAGAGSPIALVGGSEEDVLARTLWGEARGEGELGMYAVACVVLNRALRGGWWGKTPREVCLRNYQFSCWDAGTASRRAVMSAGLNDPAFVKALALARKALKTGLVDSTNGATHYYADSIAPPFWAVGKQPCQVIGHHRFYKGIN